MKREITHEIRAILLASLMVLSVVGGSVALAGSVTAATQLDASDGAGGNYSFLFAGYEDELPEGAQSGDDTLQVQTSNLGETLDNSFYGSLTLDQGSDITFNTEQSAGDVKAVAYSGQNEEPIRIDEIGPKRVEFASDFEGSAFDEGPEGIRVNNLSFDTDAAENATLTWTIEESSGDDATAKYRFEVDEFQTGVVATDEEGGNLAAVTAGAANQTMVSDTGANNPVLQGTDASASFPDEFQVTLSPEGENITFDENNAERVSAVSPNGDAQIESVESSRVVVSISGFEPPTTAGNYDIVELHGLTYDVPADAKNETLSWEVRGSPEATYNLTAEKLDVAIDGTHEFPRGLNQQPEAGEELTSGEDGIVINLSATGKNTDGFQDADETLEIVVPEAQQGHLEFDRSADPDGSLSEDGSISDSGVMVNVIDEHTLSVTLPEDLDAGETVTVTGVTFNTTEIEESEIGEADFESGLDVRYEPVDALSEVERSTGSNALNVTVPEITVKGNSTAFAPDQTINAENGTSDIAIKVEDVTGHQMAGDEDIVVRLDGSDAIRFNESQDLVAENNIDGQGRRQVEVVSPYEIRILGDGIFDNTSNGEYHLLRAADDNGIKFDIENAVDGASANFTVQTNAADAPVTQLAETVVTVESAEATASPEQVAAHGSDNATVNVEVTEPGDQPAEGVEVSAQVPDDADLTAPSSRTTNESGIATFDLGRATSENVTVTFVADAANIDGADENLTDEVEIVAPDVDSDAATIPVGQQSTVNVTVERFDEASGSLQSVDENITVTASGTPIDYQEAGTGGDGVATFSLDPTEEGSVAFDTTVDGIDLQTTTQVVEAEMRTDKGTVSVDDSTPVEVTVLNGTGDGLEAVEGVEVHATGDNIENRSAVTDADGNVTFDFDPESVGVIQLKATLDDGTELETAVQTVEIETDVSKVPAGQESTVDVTVTGSEGVDVGGLTVDAVSDAIADDSATTDENGVATFTFTPENAEDTTIAFDTTVDGVDLEESVVSVAPTFDVTPGAINLGAEENVTVTVKSLNATDGEMTPRDVTVHAASDDYDVSDERSTGEDGETAFTIDLTGEDEPGSVEFSTTVDGIELQKSVAAEEFDVSVSDGPVTEGETGELTVSVAPSGESAEGFTVVASGEPLENETVAEDLGGGEYELTLTPSSAGEINVSVEELDEVFVVDVEEAASGVSGGGGGYVGGGGGAIGSDISVVDASLNTTETVVDEPVEVTVTLSNDGGAGTDDVRVSDGIRTYGSEEVSVGADETVEVTVEAVFPSSGEFDLSVGDVELGTVVVEPTSTEPDIENAAAMDSRPVEDASLDEPGVTVEFENVTVEAITFGNGADGSATVADLESLPADVSESPGRLVRPMKIEVPRALSDDPATVRFSVSLVDIDGDMDNVGFARYNDGEWERLQPQVVETRGDEVVFEVETPGFSTFAVYEQQQQETPESADTATPADDVETSGFVGPLAIIVLAVVALLAVLLAVAGARVYREGEL